MMEVDLTGVAQAITSQADGEEKIASFSNAVRDAIQVLNTDVAACLAETYHQAEDVRLYTALERAGWRYAIRSAAVRLGVYDQFLKSIEENDHA